MTVHMIRVYIDPDADDVLVAQNGYIDTWLTNYQSWDIDRRGPNSRPTLLEPTGEAAHYKANWWFDWSESKAELLDNLEGHIDAYSSWYRILYHECSHDSGSESPDCPWHDNRASGTVPADIPDPEVTS